MRVLVDATRCEAYGLCVEVAPDLFELDDFGYASPRGTGEVPADRIEAAKEAVAICPIRAISLRED